MKRLSMSRDYFYKREAERYARLALELGASRVEIVGARGSWTMKSRMTVSQLARFVSVEAYKNKTGLRMPSARSKNA